MSLPLTRTRRMAPAAGVLTRTTGRSKPVALAMSRAKRRRHGREGGIGAHRRAGGQGEVPRPRGEHGGARDHGVHGRVVRHDLWWRALRLRHVRRQRRHDEERYQQRRGQSARAGRERRHEGHRVREVACPSGSVNASTMSRTIFGSVARAWTSRTLRSRHEFADVVASDAAAGEHRQLAAGPRLHRAQQVGASERGVGVPCGEHVVHAKGEQCVQRRQGVGRRVERAMKRHLHGSRERHEFGELVSVIDRSSRAADRSRCRRPRAPSRR